MQGQAADGMLRGCDLFFGIIEWALNHSGFHRSAIGQNLHFGSHNGRIGGNHCQSNVLL
jgi:hypothetical protein